MTTSFADLALLELLAPQAGELILDLGCGTGQFSAELARRGCRVVGLDRSSVVLEQGRLAAPGVQFICADIRDYFPDEPFDAIVAAGVLHWLDSLADVARLLKPGGRLVATGSSAGFSLPPLEQAGFTDVDMLVHQDRYWLYAVRREVTVAS